jgi:phosphomannomutase
MRRARADFGIALDGDADRGRDVREKGFIIATHQVLALIARSRARSESSRAGGSVR